MHHIVYSS